MKRNRRWQDWVILVIGWWLLFAPFFNGYASATDAAAWNSYVGGILAVIFAGSALRSPRSKSEEWANVALGAWLVVAPFAFHVFVGEPIAAWNLIVAGAVIVGGAVWAVAAPSSRGAHAQHH